MYGLGYHQDDSDYLTVIVLLTNDKNNGELILKNKNEIEIKCGCNIGDAIILNKGVYHKVPIVQRQRVRISLNVFF